MGNTLGGKKTTKVMKINGETMKFKTPIKVEDVVKDYPGHVVLDSEAVRHYGIRAKPLEPYSNLERKKLYFLVELPKFSHDHQHRVPRRVRSAIQMSAKDRLENLLLSKRSVSDLSIMGHATRIEVEAGPHNSAEGGLTASSGMRVKMRLPKAQVEKLMSQSRDREEVAERIINMCSSKMNQDSTRSNIVNSNENESKAISKGKAFVNGNNFFDQSIARSPTGYKKRVGFSPIHEVETGIAFAAS
ncbi:uncharacterized protein At1g66480-like [Silene latifolia]|uniref:uncharacterized protein At1g66480-like n=1 Tax=Silene latifolia TaxID=37657 RepID=UPI003D78AE90